MYFGEFNVSEKMFSAFGGMIPPIDRPASGAQPANGQETLKKGGRGSIPGL